MLRPAVQPGSTLDYTLPDEEVELNFSPARRLEITTPPDVRKLASVGIVGSVKFKPRITLKMRPKKDEPIPLEISLQTGEDADLHVAYSTNEDDRPRALPLHRLLLPWAALTRPADAALDADREIPELKGGDWARGRSVFFSDQAQCAKCHQVHGRGGRIGPDLSNLIHRDYESVRRDIRLPSATIHPDYLTCLVEMKDGRVLTGVPRTEGDDLIIGDTQGREYRIRRSDVEALHPSALSIMPEGLEKTVGPERMRDLLTFLLTEPLQPAKLERDGRRRRARWPKWRRR